VGSTFRCTLPLRAATGPLPPAPRPGALHGLRVLVVDDNQTNRLILDHQLRGWEMNPTGVPSGREALAELGAAAASGRPYDFAVTDLHMPEMDGITLAEQVVRDPDLPPVHLVLLTSGGLVSAEEARRAGIQATLTKPVRRAELFDCLASVTGDRRPAGPAPARSQPVAPVPTRGRVLL